MKKFFVIMAMMFAIGVGKADAKDVNTINYSTERFEIKLGFRRLATYLNLNERQMDNCEYVFKMWKNDLLLISYDSEDRQDTLVRDAAIKNARFMRRFLNDAQYDKYFMILNQTMENNGFELASKELKNQEN